MKKYLRCFKDGLGITAGKAYEVIREERGYFVFIDDDKHEHLWSQGSVRGESYLDHFTLEAEDYEPITVLPDESLGGVMREYREVKRKAAVGERVKIVDKKFDRDTYEVGDTLTIDQVHNGEAYALNAKSHYNGSGYISTGEYVVLEPSEILVIDGARYRMVDRKAAVGERVIVTKTDKFYTRGTVITPHPRAELLDCGHINYADGQYGLTSGNYSVLEPVEPQLSALPASDQIVENIAALAARVSGLEAKVAELVSSAQAETFTKVAIGPVDTRLPSYLSPQQIRDEVVERAKADVKDLAHFGEYRAPNGKYTRAEFVVNREKRKVTVILRGVCTGDIYAVGRAICAKNDVFNVHIGKAIALRRALGLEVPAEYLSVPNPTEVRVGDIIRGGDDDTYYSSDKRFTITRICEDGSIKYAESPGDWITPQQAGSVVDDSREEVAA